MTQQTLKYPIGVQSFPEIREGGYVYVDKTEHVWNLVNSGKYYFLSRPRRFGKSLLLSTLEAYFRGRKELFDGLAIARHEKEWAEYPVIHIDLNAQVYDSVEALNSTVTNYLTNCARHIGIKVLPQGSLADKFRQLIIDCAEAKQQKVVILIDEYYKPLNSNLDNHQQFGELQTALKAFYGVLKSCDSYIKFAMLTGVARIGKVSVFSDLNNLNDISLNADYGSICGITERELESYFKTPIEQLAMEPLTITNGILTYEVLSLDPPTVAVYSLEKSSESLQIPSVITSEGITFAVTELKDFKFSFLANRVHIPASVTKIDVESLWCDWIEVDADNPVFASAQVSVLEIYSGKNLLQLSTINNKHRCSHRHAQFQ